MALSISADIKRWLSEDFWAEKLIVVKEGVAKEGKVNEIIMIEPIEKQN